MYTCDNCERGGFDIGQLYPLNDGETISYENGMLCTTCHAEHEVHLKEVEYSKRRMKELEKWVQDHADLSLEELMTKAYDEYIHFMDFGRILHIYMTK